MPDDLQLFGNRLRIQRETVLGDGGDDTTVLLVKTTGANFTRDIAGQQERIGPLRTREFLDVVHQAWEIEIRGNIRTGGFLRWLVEHVGTPTGDTERGLDVIEIRPDAGELRTFALQFDGIDDVTTFTGAALQRLSIEMRGRRKQTFVATFQALQRATGGDAWSTTDEEGGDILTTALATAAIDSEIDDPADSVVTAYEAGIEIVMPNLQPAQFNADGIPTGFSRGGNWELTGRLLLPETAGITDQATTSQFNGELAIVSATGSAGGTYEIHAGITGLVDRRSGVSFDWKQANFDFVNRRAPNDPVLRFLTDHAEF